MQRVLNWAANGRQLGASDLRFEGDPLNWQFPGGESLELSSIHMM